MKKVILWSIGCILCGICAAAGAAEVVVTDVRGEPMLMRGNQGLPLGKGMTCEAGDRIVATSGCQADFALNAIAGCRLLPSSHCVLTGTSPADMRLEVKSGNVILNLKKLPPNAKFQVETPTAIASVRGTQFWGRVDKAETPNPVTTFAVREGSVEIFSKTAGKTFMLEKGQALDIPLQAAEPVFRPALQEELAAMWSRRTPSKPPPSAGRYGGSFR